MMAQLPMAGVVIAGGRIRLAFLALWVAAQAYVLTELLRPRSQLFGQNLWFSMHQPAVALTFDDGPHPVDTPLLLETLDRCGVHATFFFVGAKARAHPDLVRRAARAGHEVASHSDTHPWWFSLAPPGRIRREVRASVDTLAQITGSRPRWFRPPMGHKSIFLSDVLRDERLTQVTWTARAFDTIVRDAEGIRRRLVDQATPGAILLLHEGARRGASGPSGAVAALPGVIEDLRARGLQVVRLRDLPGIPARSGAPQNHDGSSGSTGAAAG